MAEKNPIPWQPIPPENAADPTDISQRERKAGVISLLMSLPVPFALMAVTSLRVHHNGEHGRDDFSLFGAYSALELCCWYLIFVWCIVAVISGIIGRRTISGIIGLIVSFPVVYVAAIIFAVEVFVTIMTMAWP